MKIKLLSDTAKPPVRAHPHDAGFDLFADETVVLQSGERYAVKTGISLSIPIGYVGLIWEKSGLAVRDGVQCMGGVIDSGYTGEIKVIILNSSDKPFEIILGHKVAQLLVQQIYLGDLVIVDDLNKTHRGNSGFGSTGKV